MVAVLEFPEIRYSVQESPVSWPSDMGGRVAAMGDRLRRAYVEGAIPYLRDHEQDLWSELSRLDANDSPAALDAYESLFMEGLLRYAAALARKAA